jgi:ribosomal protein S13
MAGLAALCTWLTDVIGCTHAFRDGITTDQGITDIEMLGELEEEDIRTLCNNIQKSGGLIVNPDAGQAGEPAQIRNPGVNVSLIVENRLTNFSIPVDASMDKIEAIIKCVASMQCMRHMVRVANRTSVF